MKNALGIFISLALLVSTAAIAADESPAAQPPPPGAAPAGPGPAAMGTPNPRSFPAPGILMAFRFLHPRAAVVLAEQLKLTDDQRTKVADLVEKLDEALNPKVEVQRKAADAFANAMIDSNTTQAAIAAAAEKVMKAELDLISEYTKALQDVRALLTQEQSKLLQQFLERHTMPFRAMRPRPPADQPPPPSAPAGPAAATN